MNCELIENGRIALTKPERPNTELFMRYGPGHRLMVAVTEEEVRAREEAREERTRRREAARLAREQAEVAEWERTRLGPFARTRDERPIARERARADQLDHTARRKAWRDEGEPDSVFGL